MANDEGEYACAACGGEISEREYEENEGQYDNCVAEDDLVATGVI